jgi:hypothetical protein
MARVKNAGKKGKQNKSQTETRTQQPKTPEELLADLVARIRENATAQDKFIQLTNDLKKVGPGLSLTGLERVYKQPEKSDFVYSLEHRVAAPSAGLDKILGHLGTSLAGQRLKNDIVDLTNYSQHLVVRPPVQREVVPEKHFNPTDISDLARRIKESRTAAKEEKANASPRKKRAQRRKSPTGVTVARTPRVAVDRLLANVETLSDVLRRLSEKQQGLDLTSVTFEESSEGLVAVGARVFRIRHKSKRAVVDYAGGHLSAETPEVLETVLRRVSVSDADVSALVSSLRTKLSQEQQVVEKAKAQGNKAQGGKSQGNKAQGGKAQGNKAQGNKQGKTTTQPEAQEEKPVAEKKPAKKVAEKQAPVKKVAEPRNSPKVTKAKTRAVKPRTSHE